MSLKQDLLNIIYGNPEDTSTPTTAKITTILADKIEFLETVVAGITTDTLTVVPTFADLPDPVTAGLNALALVKTTTGILFINRKRKGIYVSDGTQWLYTTEFDASQLAYDNTASSLAAVNIQDAIDELDTTLDTALQPGDNISTLVNDSDFQTLAEVEALIASAPAPTPALVWTDYATRWDTAPTLNKAITGGQVFNYTLNGTTRFRFVPTTYDSNLDAFYSGFNNTTDVLSGLLAKRND